MTIQCSSRTARALFEYLSTYCLNYRKTKVYARVEFKPKTANVICVSRKFKSKYWYFLNFKQLANNIKRFCRSIRMSPTSTWSVKDLKSTVVNRKCHATNEGGWLEFTPTVPLIRAENFRMVNIEINTWSPGFTKPKIRLIRIRYPRKKFKIQPISVSC